MKILLALFCILQAILISVQEEEDCDCRKVDGGLSEWTRFSPCSVSCGAGKQSRVRYCTNPYPQYGGDDCTGNLIDCKACNIKDCPVDGGWTEFVASGTCSKSCGGGQQTFTRNCTNPSPAHCGKPCEGNSTKVEECNGHGCPEWMEPYNNCDSCIRNSTNNLCQKLCKQRCYYQGVVVDDSLCLGYAPEKTLECDDKECDDIPDDNTACKSCYQKALAEAATFTNTYWKNNFPGHACRDSEVSGDLAAICQQTDQSVNGGIISNNWFWIHCSPDGPWCKPCATRNLVFNKKCDACELTADGACTGAGRRRR